LTPSVTGPPTRAESENVGAGGGLSATQAISPRARRPGCVFCDIVAGELTADVVATNDQAAAFRDRRPAAPTHVLVVPRRHVEDAAALAAGDADLLAGMLLLAQEVAALDTVDGRGYRLVMNVGADAGNTIPHLHLHVLGGRPLGALG
jgi:histidine triad (HIT) family protein